MQGDLIDFPDFVLTFFDESHLLLEKNGKNTTYKTKQTKQHQTNSKTGTTKPITTTKAKKLTIWHMVPTEHRLLRDAPLSQFICQLVLISRNVTQLGLKLLYKEFNLAEKNGAFKNPCTYLLPK